MKFDCMRAVGCHKKTAARHISTQMELMVRVNPKYPKFPQLHRLGHRASTFVSAASIYSCRRVSIPFTIGADARTGCLSQYFLAKAFKNNNNGRSKHIPVSHSNNACDTGCTKQGIRIHVHHGSAAEL